MSAHWLHSVHHDGSARYVSQPTPRLGESVRLRLRADERAPIRAAYVLTVPDGEQALASMHLAGRQSPVQWWEAELPINEPRVHYCFILVADDGVWFFGVGGITDYIPPHANDFCILADYDPPDWVGESVFYQIFPDTFANGDPSLDPTPETFEYGGRWPRTYPWGQPLPEGAPYGQSYYGGDLPGIIQHLDHVQALGANALYLTPVFRAYSCHRYDAVDYDTVDPILGGNQALADLRAALDARGMHYILDTAPNHCGVAHPWFQAAQADKNAPEYEFFTFTRHPDEYAYWTFSPALAKLNYRSAELRHRMYGNADAPLRRWLQPPYGADGWRVDVGNMLARQGAVQLNAEVIREIRAAVKEARPDAYLIGENFHEASAQLQGDQWDGAMNYSGFFKPLLYWLNGLVLGALGFPHAIFSPVPFTTQALAATWRDRRAAIPWIVAQQQLNLLGSHDTPRIRTELRGNDALQRLAIVAQMTFPGVPCVYYGDEIGMVDTPGVQSRSAASRACMIWDEARWDHDLLAFYQDLITLRHRSPVLRRGGFQMLLVEDDTFVYQREGVTGRMVVVAHRSEAARSAGTLPVAHGGIADGARFVEHFTGHQVEVQGGALPLPELAQGATLWEEID